MKKFLNKNPIWVSQVQFKYKKISINKLILRIKINLSTHDIEIIFITFTIKVGNSIQ